jgi:DNA-binding GntR family transcriptional regulator
MTKTFERQTVATVTIDRMRDLITSGELTAGEALRQDELSARLGVSRTPLREAIIRLQAEGLVVNHPHKGAVVYKPTVEELEEIYEIRILLETYAARLAVTRMTDEIFTAVQGLVDELDTAENPWDLVRLNHEFRQTFYSATRNKHLVELIRNLTLRAEPYVRILVGGVRRPFKREEFHSLLAAIRDRNATRAEAITRAHLETTVQYVMPVLKRPAPVFESFARSGS